MDLERPPESQPIQESANLEEVEEISDPKSGFLPEFGHFATVLRSYARSQLHKLDDDSVIRKVLLSGWHCASAFLNWLKNRLASNTIEPGKNWQHHSTSGSIDYYLSLAVPGEMGVEVAEEIILTSSLGEKFLINALPNIPCVDLVVAHDYFTIPFASIVCEKSGCEMAIDIHEYAREQYVYKTGSDEDRYHQFIVQPMVKALHDHYFQKAIGVTSVCEGLSRQLCVDHHLAVMPTTVRSVPFYSEQERKKSGDMIQVLYHGLVDPTRHLEVGVRSTVLWNPQYHFVIRGPGPSDYIAKLHRLCEELGVSDRVTIQGPVAFEKLVAEANSADIGYLAFMNFSRQREFASPNKFFEYIMAGLALVVMDVPELAPVVKDNGVGRLITDFTPESIADVINSFDKKSIDRCREASLKLAKTLNWETEQEKMISAYQLPEFEKNTANQIG